jgi:NAD-dependent SIR2 family protein deacetylase
MTAVPPQLKRLYKDGRLVVFVGSGASTAVQWTNSDQTTGRGVTWRGLVDKAAELLGHPDADLLRVRGNDLQILEYFKAVESGPTKLTNWFLQQMNPPDDALKESPIHQALVSLEGCNLFYTTNFDNFLERSFDLHGRPHSSVVDEKQIAQHLAIVAASSGEARAEIVKFHGDLDHPNRMVLSESDYEKRLRFAEPEDQRLISDLLGRSVLFVGYSFRDANVAYLFRQISEHGELPEAPGARRAYITVFDPSDFERRLFDSRHMSVIPLDSRDRTAATAAFLRELSA